MWCIVVFGIPDISSIFHTIRLWLHIVIFFVSICGWFHSECQRFCLHHVHGAIFSTHLSWRFGGEKLSLSRSIFEIKFHSSVCNVDTALPDPVYSTTNMYAHHWKLSILCKDMWRKNHSGAHGHSLTCFCVINFFCKITHRYETEYGTGCCFIHRQVAKSRSALGMVAHLLRLLSHAVGAPRVNKWNK